MNLLLQHDMGWNENLGKWHSNQPKDFGAETNRSHEEEQLENQWREGACGTGCNQ
jgi:hypothetical protein